MRIPLPEGVILVQCPHCRTQFIAGPQMDLMSFERSAVWSSPENCGECHRAFVATRDHAAYRLRDGSLKHVGSQFDPTQVPRSS